MRTDFLIQALNIKLKRGGKGCIATDTAKSQRKYHEGERVYVSELKDVIGYGGHVYDI